MGEKYQRFTEGESKTQKEHKDDVDINKIVARYKKGILPRGHIAKPVYGDFFDLPDYHELQNRVANLENEFLKMDPHIRKKFNNNPQNLITWLQNEDNWEEAEKLGFITIEKKESLKGQPEASGDTKKEKDSEKPSESKGS
jgi:phage internal scaffolding protein